MSSYTPPTPPPPPNALTTLSPSRKRGVGAGGGGGSHRPGARLQSKRQWESAESAVLYPRVEPCGFIPPTVPNEQSCPQKIRSKRVVFVGHSVQCVRQCCETAVTHPQAQRTHPIQSTTPWRPPLRTLQSRSPCCGPASCGNVEHAPRGLGHFLARAEVARHFVISGVASPAPPLPHPHSNNCGSIRSSAG